MLKACRVLSNQELKKYICGAVCFDETDGLIPYRFTKEKLENANSQNNFVMSRIYA